LFSGANGLILGQPLLIGNDVIFDLTSQKVGIAPADCAMDMASGALAKQAITTKPTAKPMDNAAKQAEPISNAPSLGCPLIAFSLGLLGMYF